MGLLTRIFGNRDDEAPGEGSERADEGVEGNPMRAPDDPARPDPLEPSVDASPSPTSATSVPSPPEVDRTETAARRQAGSARSQRRATSVPPDTGVRSSTRPVQHAMEREPREPAPFKLPAQTAVWMKSDAMARETASTSQPASRRRPSRAPAARRNGGTREPEVSAERVARPNVRQRDAAPNHSFPLTRAIQPLHAGANVSPVAPGGALARDTAGGAAVHAAGGMSASGGGGARSGKAPAETEDPEEIDVSDQLEAVDDLDISDDLDMSDDLDATDDLIIEEDDEDDEETSTSVSVWGAGASTAGGPLVQVAVAEALAPDARPVPGSETGAEGEGHPQCLEPSSTSAAEGFDSDLWEPSGPEPEMGMRRETQSIKRTVVEAGTELEGTLKSSYPVLVSGRFDGDIDAPMLSVASGGMIFGTVKAKTLHSQGTLSGRIDAGEAVVSGAVRSQTVIKANRLEMKIGAADGAQLEVTFGICKLEPSELDPFPASTSNAESDSDPFTPSGWE